MQRSRTETRFTQTLDRAAFGTYFVGAVVPLLSLAVMLERFVLPALGNDTWGTWSAIGGLTAVGLISLSAFLFLRRLIHQALHRMKTDNERLGRILGASQTLSSAPHARAVAETVAQCALELSEAEAALVLLQSGPEKLLEVCETAGEGAAALYAGAEEELGDLFGVARSSGQPVLASFGRGSEIGVSAVAAVPLAGEAGVSGIVVVLHTRPGAEFEPEVRDALAALSGLAAVALKSADLQDAQRNFFIHVTEILSVALDNQMNQRQGHAARVALIANRIGRSMQLDDGRMQRLHFSALLHDIGMLRIPVDEHTNHTVMRRHPLLGSRMLSPIRLWADIAPIVLHHHESFDGSGYPEGLQAQQIPLEARIIHVADAFDLLIRGETDGVPRTPEEAVRVLRGESGERFDPEIFSSLAGIVERGELPSF